MKGSMTSSPTLSQKLYWPAISDNIKTIIGKCRHGDSSKELVISNNISGKLYWTNIGFISMN